MDMIKLKNISVYYDNLCAIKDINLSVAKNDLLAIVGPNGGGKSTLLKVILGILKPSSGNISVNTDSFIGYVPQFSKFDKNFPITVSEVILMGTLGKRKRLFHKYTNNDLKSVTDIMKRLNIYHLRDRQIGQLSGGQLQRVLIARALAVNPQILVLDEPTASLDVPSRNQIYSLLKDLNSHMTIILVTHDLSLISNYVSKIVYLHKELKCYNEQLFSKIVVE